MPKATIENVVAAPPILPDEKLLRLLPGEYSLDPASDVRLGPPRPDEDKRIEQLAQSIYEQGQLEPCLVRRDPKKKGHYLLSVGRRRAAAVDVVRKNTGIADYPLLAALSDKSDDDVWIGAIHENSQRENFTPIQYANLITEIKKREKLDGKDWTEPVSNILGVSRSTVSQHVKLLKLAKADQDKVHTGILSMQSALDLLEIPEPVREPVLKRAEELAEEEEKAKPPSRASKKAAKAAGTVKDTSKAPPEAPGPVSAPAEAKSDKAETGKIKRKHVLRAAREVEATTKPRTRRELLEIWQEVIDTDVYSEQVHALAKIFIGKYAEGTASDRQFLNKLDAVDELCQRKGGKKIA